MLVHEVMSSPALTVARRVAPDAAFELMAQHAVSSLPVVDERGDLVGILSEADLLRASLPPDPRAHLRSPVEPTRRQPLLVADVMTAAPRTTTSSSDVAEVALVFAGTSWKSLPVLRGRTLVGVISRSDVIRALARDDDDVAQDVNAGLHQWGGMAAHATVRHGVVEISGTGTSQQGLAAVAVASTVQGVRWVQLAEPDCNKSDGAEPDRDAAERGEPSHREPARTDYRS